MISFFWKYTLKSISSYDSYLSAVLYKFFTLASRPKISIHCFTGDSGAQVHDFSQCFLCLLLPFLIFPAIVRTRLIRRRRKRREALSLRERSRELRLFSSLSWDMPSMDDSVVGWSSSSYPARSYSSVGPPAAQVHDSPQGLLWLLCLLISHSARNHGRRGRRELLGPRKGPEVVLGMLVNRPHGVIPSAKALILECLHCSHTCCHHPSFPHMTHLLNFLSPKLKTTINNKKRWFWVANAYWRSLCKSKCLCCESCGEEVEVKVGWFYSKRWVGFGAQSLGKTRGFGQQFSWVDWFELEWLLCPWICDAKGN